MSPPRRGEAGFSARGEEGLGWPHLYAKQASALARALARADTALVLPPSPVPAPPRSEERAEATAGRRGTAGVARAAAFAAKALILALAFYVLATSLLVASYRFVDPPATVLMAWRKFSFGWKIVPPSPRPLKKTPLYIRRMLVSVEDYRFYEHHGVDFEAFKNAQAINKRIGKPLYGGSTLTMQVARTLFLVPVKSYVRKGLEVIVALELELFLGKDRILELYLDYAEWGKGVFGIEAAARKWYGAGTQALGRDQAARLIALLSSPVKYSPSTLQRNGILRARYLFLTRRYVAPAQPESGDAGAAAGAAKPPNVSDAAAGASPDQPPPSVEPGAEGPEAAPDSPAGAADSPNAPAPASGAGAGAGAAPAPATAP